MKIGLISYPMLFQKNGGLQIQISETLKALKEVNVDAYLFNIYEDKLEDFDIIHVFSANHGNHHVVKLAKAAGCKVVISPLAEAAWSTSIAKRSKWIEKILGKATNYLNYSIYSLVNSAFTSADHLIALGSDEKKALVNGFDIPEQRVSIVGNGIPERFFFENITHIPDEVAALGHDYILCVGTIGERKNQLSLVKSIANYLPEKKVVLVGPIEASEKQIFDELNDYEQVTYYGECNYDAPDLPALYKNAAIFALPSKLEIYPLSVLEALAAGTPSIVTSNSSMNFECKNAEFQQVSPYNLSEIATKIQNVYSTIPKASSCQELVADVTWKSIALQLKSIYKSI